MCSFGKRIAKLIFMQKTGVIPNKTSESNILSSVIITGFDFDAFIFDGRQNLSVYLFTFYPLTPICTSCLSTGNTNCVEFIRGD